MRVSFVHPRVCEGSQTGTSPETVEKTTNWIRPPEPPLDKSWSIFKLFTPAFGFFGVKCSFFANEWLFPFETFCVYRFVGCLFHVKFPRKHVNPPETCKTTYVFKLSANETCEAVCHCKARFHWLDLRNISLRVMSVFVNAKAPSF